MEPQRIIFPSCVVDVYADTGMWTYYPDGAKAWFGPDITDPEQVKCAEMFGFGDQVRLYANAHDIGHHFVAHALGAPHSRVIWAEAHKFERPWRETLREDKERPWPWRCSDEEHLVNSLLTYINTGKLDEPYFALTAIWPDNLPAVAAAYSDLIHGGDWQGAPPVTGTIPSYPG